MIGVSQSGETAYILPAQREAEVRNGNKLAVPNVVGSTLIRESDEGVYIWPGSEIGIATTKKLDTQEIPLNLSAELLTDRAPDGELLSVIRDLSGHLQEILVDTRADSFVHIYPDCDRTTSLAEIWTIPLL